MRIKVDVRSVQSSEVSYTITRALPFFFFSYLLNVIDEGVLVVLPIALQSFFRWEFFTAKLHCDFKAVAAEVIEILHSYKARKELWMDFALFQSNWSKEEHVRY